MSKLNISSQFFSDLLVSSKFFPNVTGDGQYFLVIGFQHVNNGILTCPPKTEPEVILGSGHRGGRKDGIIDHIGHLSPKPYPYIDNQYAILSVAHNMIVAGGLIGNNN